MCMYMHMYFYMYMYCLPVHSPTNFSVAIPRQLAQGGFLGPHVSTHNASKGRDLRLPLLLLPPIDAAEASRLLALPTRWGLVKYQDFLDRVLERLM